ncbi:phBC6A51 family helix-turn-helix protein [Lysinibacillus sp. Bpr_S20]|uniref:phBC6A51 family helix-turn-helix protein n=1 Tax=Lysinibacillus sp. Bpr_S20 TaxID=2933964 RepID=UPI002013BEA5|nr:phBC6A51 family helix-turn-helix protein [Lysinibacillus sp. Bpr_S20]MCL1701175.1 phBC6A51 family helix-turn-helix protein [Lysinibacillus sp. Bpr_S20]
MDKINEIKPSPSLSENMVKFAKSYVKLRIVDGLSVGDICKTLGVSTKTFYSWKENEAFNSYLKALEASYVTEDEVHAYNHVRKHILKMVSKENPTDKHVEMFLKHFSHVAESESQKHMNELGISTNTRSSRLKEIEERRASLAKYGFKVNDEGFIYRD